MPSSLKVGRGIFFSEMNDRTFGGRLSTRITPSSLRITIRSMRFSSSRTLPGQSYSHKCTIASSAILHVRAVCLPLYFSRTVSYTHLRAHETPEHLVCRLL